MSTAIPTRSTAIPTATVPSEHEGPNDASARLLGALGVAGVALIHIINAPDAYASARYIFWLYMALVAVAVPMITLLLQWRSPLVWAATAVLAGAPFVSYLLSRSIGLPGDTGEIGDWVNPLGTASLFVEASLIVLSVTRLRALSQPAGPGRGANGEHHESLVWRPTATPAATPVAHTGSRSRAA